MKDRNEDILRLRRELKDREETIQQREIDISCLRGQVKQALEDIDDDDSSTLTFMCSEGDEDIVLLDDLLEEDMDLVVNSSDDDERQRAAEVQSSDAKPFYKLCYSDKEEGK